MSKLTREYLEDKIAKAQSAIAFAVPGADISFAKATLTSALIKLDEMDAAEARLRDAA